jgi:hypothetical protein
VIVVVIVIVMVMVMVMATMTITVLTLRQASSMFHTQQCPIELRSECNKSVINGDQNTQSSNKFGGQPHMLAGDGQGNVKRRFHSCVAAW